MRGRQAGLPLLLLLCLLLRLGFLLVLVVLVEGSAGRPHRRAFLPADHRAASAAHDGALGLAVLLLRRLRLGVLPLLWLGFFRGTDAAGQQDCSREQGGMDSELLEGHVRSPESLNRAHRLGTAHRPTRPASACLARRCCETTACPLHPK